LDDRKQLGAAARNLAYKLQINMILLGGTAKRRTYAHDLYYGIETLFVLFGKPWNAACEGMEHAHKEMKRTFHGMVSHWAETSDVDQMLVLHYVRKAVTQQSGHMLPQTKETASRTGLLVHRKIKKNARQRAATATAR